MVLLLQYLSLVHIVKNSSIKTSSSGHVAVTMALLCFSKELFSWSIVVCTPLQLALQQRQRLQLVRRTLHTTSHVFLDMLISWPAFSVGVQEYWFSLLGTLLAVVPARGMAWLLVVVAAACHLLCSCVYPNYRQPCSQPILCYGLISSGNSNTCSKFT